MRALAIVLVLFGCAEARDVRDVLAAHGQRQRRIEAPTSEVRRPWTVGQWTLYKLTDGTHVGYSKTAVVATGSCGTWIENTYVQDKYDDRLTMKSCFAKQTDGPLTDFDALQAVMTREHDVTVVIDFRNGQNPKTKQKMKNAYARFVTLAWQSAPATEAQQVLVPAGHFIGAQKLVTRMWAEESLHGVEVWVHPEVPLGGAIKLVADDGHEAVLLDYGLTGAKSELPDFDEHLEESVAQ